MNESRKSSGFWMNSSIKSRFSSICDELDNTDYIMNNTFWVGVYPGMNDKMIDYMARIIIEAVK